MQVVVSCTLAGVVSHRHKSLVSTCVIYHTPFLIMILDIRTVCWRCVRIPSEYETITRSRAGILPFSGIGRDPHVASTCFNVPRIVDVFRDFALFSALSLLPPSSCSTLCHHDPTPLHFCLMLDGPFAKCTGFDIGNRLRHRMD